MKLQRAVAVHRDLAQRHATSRLMMNLLYITLLFPWALLAAPTSATQVTLPDPLTPENFADTISQPGLWLVEHYSPWCHHCKVCI